MRLTPRQKEILVLYSRGRKGLALAGDLHISKRTLDSHIENIQERLGTACVAQSLVVAIARNEIEIDPVGECARVPTLQVVAA